MGTVENTGYLLKVLGKVNPEITVACVAGPFDRVCATGNDTTPIGEFANEVRMAPDRDGRRSVANQTGDVTEAADLA